MQQSDSTTPPYKLIEGPWLYKERLELGSTGVKGSNRFEWTSGIITAAFLEQKANYVSVAVRNRDECIQLCQALFRRLSYAGFIATVKKDGTIDTGMRQCYIVPVTKLTSYDINRSDLLVTVLPDDQEDIEYYDKIYDKHFLELSIHKPFVVVSEVRHFITYSHLLGQT